MNTKRIFAAYLFIALLAVGASAQSNDRNAPWKKYLGRNRVAAPAQPPVVESAPQKGEQPADIVISGAASKGRLGGTWLATVTFEDGFELKVLFTFMQGNDANEGTLIDTNEFLLTPGPTGAPDQGVWQRTGSRAFIATHLAFLFDGTDGAPAGTAKVRDAINIDGTGDQFTGIQFVEVFDADGALVFSGHGTMTGTRVKAQAPPAN